MLWSIVVALCALLMLAAFLIVLLQDLQIVPALLKELELESLPEGVKQFSVPVEPGVVLEVWSYGSGRIPLLFLHGNADTVETFFQHQVNAAKQGYVVYQFDYRGVGRSTGWPSEEGLYRDATRVLEFICEREKCKAQNIVVIGQSLGSGPACFLAEKFQIVRLILYTPYTSLPAVVRQRPILRFLVPFVWYVFPNLPRLQRWAEQQDSRELILVHGHKDTVITFTHSREIQQNLQSEKPTISEEAPNTAPITGPIAVRLIEEHEGAHDEIITRTWNAIAPILAEWTKQSVSDSNAGW
jgi:pimeloyl-ACP methyl ester carboxylesterase